VPCRDLKALPGPHRWGAFHLPKRFQTARVDGPGRGLGSSSSYAALGAFPIPAGRRRRVGKALLAVVMEPCVHRESTGKVDELVKAVGAKPGVSKAEPPRIRQGLDRDPEESCNRMNRNNFPLRFSLREPLRSPRGKNTLPTSKRIL